jgi:hypothetical protein
MRISRSRLGRALGYGEITVASAGQELALSHVTFVPYPEQVNQDIIALLFPETAG